MLINNNSCLNIGHCHCSIRSQCLAPVPKSLTSLGHFSWHQVTVTLKQSMYRFHFQAVTVACIAPCEKLSQIPSNLIRSLHIPTWNANDFQCVGSFVGILQYTDRICRAFPGATFEQQSVLAVNNYTTSQGLGSYFRRLCHMAFDFLWLWSISFQWLPSFPGLSGPSIHRPMISPCPIRSWSITQHSRPTFGSTSAGTLKVRASFQTGFVELRITEVFFLLIFFPSTRRVNRT